MRIDDTSYQLILDTPKVVLHDHLGGSTDLAILKAQLIDQGHRDGMGWEDLRDSFRVGRWVTHQLWEQSGVVDETTHLPSTLEEYRQAYDRSASLVKSLSSQYLAAYLYVHRAVQENVRYAEIRFNPFGKGGTPEELTHFICEGLNDARHALASSGQPFEYGLIFTAYRHGDPALDPDTGLSIKAKRALDVAKVAARLVQQGYPVVGVDLAGNEAEHPVTEFGAMLDFVKTFNRQQVAAGQAHRRLGITLHAGETPRSGPLTGAQSIATAVDMAYDEHTPVRIGHGIRAEDDPVLLHRLIALGIGLEMCPKSNAQTLAIVPRHREESSYRHHPAVRLLKQGVKVSISSDNQTVSNSNATNEFVKLHQHLGAHHAERKQFIFNALDTAFIFDEDRREALRRQLLAQFYRLEHESQSASRIMQERTGRLPSIGQRLLWQVRDHYQAWRRVLGNVPPGKPTVNPSTLLAAPKHIPESLTEVGPRS
jgi:adenosine deaminase